MIFHTAILRKKGSFLLGKHGFSMDTCHKEWISLVETQAAQLRSRTSKGLSSESLSHGTSIHHTRSSKYLLRIDYHHGFSDPNLRRHTSSPIYLSSGDGVLASSKSISVRSSSSWSLFCTEFGSLDTDDDDDDDDDGDSGKLSNQFEASTHTPVFFIEGSSPNVAEVANGKPLRGINWELCLEDGETNILL